MATPVVLATLALAAAAVLALPYLAFPVRRRHRAGQHYDVIVVLGNKVGADGTPGPQMRARVGRAVELFREGAAPKVLMTGAAAHNRFVEAETMRDLAVALGVPAGAIALETEARNTRENARFVAALMERRAWRTAVVVTSGFHVRRANRHFEEAGVHHAMAAAPAPRETPWLLRLRRMAQEHWVLTKMAVQQLRPKG